MTSISPVPDRESFAPADRRIPLRTAVRAGALLAVSGQVGHVDFTLVDGGFEAELRQAMINLRTVLAEHGADLRDVVKVNVLLTDIADFDLMGQVYLEFFTGDELPARTACAVAALPFGALVEVEAWAMMADARPSDSSSAPPALMPIAGGVTRDESA